MASSDLAISPGVPTLQFDHSEECVYSFSCHNDRSIIDKMQKIYDHAVQGRSHKDLTPNHGRSPIEGNKRGHLYECSCGPLDRLQHPAARLLYEDRVITRIFSKIREQIKTQDTFSIKLAIFGSGGLFGEEVLLFRLLDRINKAKIQGKIRLFLIDECYDRKNKAYSKAKKALSQFMQEMSQCLPSKVTLKGHVFSSGRNYINKAQRNRKYKHDLLIGADTEKNAADDGSAAMAEIARQAGLNPKEEPIALIKEKPTGTPCIATIPINGKLNYALDGEVPLAPFANISSNTGLASRQHPIVGREPVEQSMQIPLHRDNDLSSSFTQSTTNRTYDNIINIRSNTPPVMQTSV